LVVSRSYGRCSPGFSFSSGVFFFGLRSPALISCRVRYHYRVAYSLRVFGAAFCLARTKDLSTSRRFPCSLPLASPRFASCLCALCVSRLSAASTLRLLRSASRLSTTCVALFRPLALRRSATALSESFGSLFVQFSITVLPLSLNKTFQPSLTLFCFFSKELGAPSQEPPPLLRFLLLS